MNKVMLLSSLVCVSVYGAERLRIKSSSEMEKMQEGMLCFFTQAMLYTDCQIAIRKLEEKKENGTLDEVEKAALEKEIEEKNAKKRNIVACIPLRHFEILRDDRSFNIRFVEVPTFDEMLAQALVQAAIERRDETVLGRVVRQNVAPNVEVNTCNPQ